MVEGHKRYVRSSIFLLRFNEQFPPPILMVDSIDQLTATYRLLDNSREKILFNFIGEAVLECIVINPV